MEFNNQNKELLSNTLALNVALQTIKERCVHLQKRLYLLESENQKLRLNTINSPNSNESRKDNSLISELEDLRSKNAELSLQKNQLTENLQMISTENRQLWKRLSRLTKENVVDDDADLAKGRAEEEEEDQAIASSAKHANLIRSKTFTQNSPHQLLREKIAGNHIKPVENSPSTTTADDLEDISLINDYEFAASSGKFSNAIEAIPETETCDLDTRTCTEGLLNIKKNLLKQNEDLRLALSNWRKLKSMLIRLLLIN